MKGSGVYRFGEFQLDALELRLRGERLAILPKPFRLLLYLVENRHRISPKDQVLEDVWPAVSVSDTALSTALKQVRQALEDDGAEQRWIRTLRGRGYQFVGPVEEVFDDRTVKVPLDPDDQEFERRTDYEAVKRWGSIRVGEGSLKSPVTMGSRGSAVAPDWLAAAREAFAEGRESELDDSLRAELWRHTPRTIEEYRLRRWAEWSQLPYALDRRFTPLHMTLTGPRDEGHDAIAGLGQTRRRVSDLHKLLFGPSPKPFLVLLGDPGHGKSTLLRRLELDLAVDALRRAADDAPLSFLLPLGRYRARRVKDLLPAPSEWLATEWARLYPDLDPFDAQLRSGRMVLLLDAVNEMPHGSDADYRELIALWQSWLVEVAKIQGTRVVFSCRSLDYSAPLSTPELKLPHVRIEPLSDEHIEKFLKCHDAAQFWSELRESPQLRQFRSPFYLKLLIEALETGQLVQGTAGLLTRFVRRALTDELEKQSDLLADDAVLHARDRNRIARNTWGQGHALTTLSPLVPALERLAFDLQERRGSAKVSQVRATHAQALDLLGSGAQGQRLLEAAAALQILAVDDESDDVSFVHQLMQEYFAARLLATKPDFKLVRTPWRSGDVEPWRYEERARIAADPFPPAPSTGWEETFVFAAAMAADPDAFLAALASENLPLAGRCAAQSDVAISAPLHERLQQELLARSRNAEADLRARIAAVRALGELGDPRLERQTGPHGDFLLPQFIEIEAGDYKMGSTEGQEHETPVHAVRLQAFAIAQFPVTNAEWALFMASEGYDDERWWESDEARRWRRGEGVADAPRQTWRDLRRSYQRPGEIDERLASGLLASTVAEQWRTLCALSDEEFEVKLKDWHPDGRRAAPDSWNDPVFNHPSQPVVGICWYEANAYCRWLSAQSGQHLQIPSEAMWEAAARGKEDRLYAWGKEFGPAYCNTSETHVRATTPIGVFSAGDTPDGIYDMAGNVWEWVADDWHPSYAGAPTDGIPWVDAPRADRRVARGGSWDDPPFLARCAARNRPRPGLYDGYLGFRVVRVPVRLRGAGRE